MSAKSRGYFVEFFISSPTYQTSGLSLKLRGGRILKRTAEGEWVTTPLTNSIPGTHHKHSKRDLEGQLVAAGVDPSMFQVRWLHRGPKPRGSDIKQPRKLTMADGLLTAKSGRCRTPLPRCSDRRKQTRASAVRLTLDLLADTTVAGRERQQKNNKE